jgi:hypothetical protein
MESVARVLVQIPDRRRHLVRYYGANSSAALRRRWAELIRRVYEVDPLVCPRCGGEMRVIGFITQPALIDRILDHLKKRGKLSRPTRPPPLPPRPLPSPA